MGYLKGKSSLMIFDRHANLKYKYGNRHFWCRGYYEWYKKGKLQNLWFHTDSVTGEVFCRQQDGFCFWRYRPISMCKTCFPVWELSGWTTSKTGFFCCSCQGCCMPWCICSAPLFWRCSFPRHTTCRKPWACILYRSGLICIGERRSQRRRALRFPWPVVQPPAWYCLFLGKRKNGNTNTGDKQKKECTGVVHSFFCAYRA